MISRISLEHKTHPWKNFTICRREFLFYALAVSILLVISTLVEYNLPYSGIAPGMMIGGTSGLFIFKLLGARCAFQISVNSNEAVDHASNRMKRKIISSGFPKISQEPNGYIFRPASIIILGKDFSKYLIWSSNFVSLVPYDKVIKITAPYLAVTVFRNFARRELDHAKA